MNTTQQQLHAAIDTLIAHVVGTAAPAGASTELRAEITQIAVDRMLADLLRAHPGIVAPEAA